jgi:hypothetical protein
MKMMLPQRRYLFRIGAECVAHVGASLTLPRRWRGGPIILRGVIAGLDPAIHLA